MDTATYDRLLKKAVQAFWSTLKSAVKKNQQGKRKDSGTRGGATAGKNLDGFVQLVCSYVLSEGSTDIEIHERKKLVTLPGYFRPTKQWDIVITRGERLLAAIELKSLGGPSFGNNANNRCEEAIGSAVDFRTVQREGGFGKGASPFLGYFILVHDLPASRKPPSKAPASIQFPCDREFDSASYQQRMAILCERMMQEGLYDCAAAVSSPPITRGTAARLNELSETASFRRLLVKLAAHIKSETSLL